LKLTGINYLTPVQALNPDNDNVDVHVGLDDGRVYSLLVATPSNIYWCMQSEGVDYFFGTPPLMVRRLTRECIEGAISALLSEDGGRWLEVYGTLQLPHDDGTVSIQ
jgi:hypothetical protein